MKNKLKLFKIVSRDFNSLPSHIQEKLIWIESQNQSQHHIDNSLDVSLKTDLSYRPKVLSVSIKKTWSKENPSFKVKLLPDNTLSLLDSQELEKNPIQKIFTRFIKR